MPVGEPSKTPQPVLALRLVRATAASWTKEREAEGRERGYEVTYRKDGGVLVATFWNGPFRCYDREYVL